MYLYYFFKFFNVYLNQTTASYSFCKLTEMSLQYNVGLLLPLYHIGDSMRDLGTCSRVRGQCSEGVLAPPHTTSLPFCLDLRTLHFSAQCAGLSCHHFDYSLIWTYIYIRWMLLHPPDGGGYIVCECVRVCISGAGKPHLHSLHPQSVPLFRWCMRQHLPWTTTGTWQCCCTAVP